MVYFPDMKNLVMVSDQITDATPIVDFANGGSAVSGPKSLTASLKAGFRDGPFQDEAILPSKRTSGLSR
jgi:hypothetical protein